MHIFPTLYLFKIILKISCRTKLKLIQTKRKTNIKKGVLKMLNLISIKKNQKLFSIKPLLFLFLISVFIFKSNANPVESINSDPFNSDLKIENYIAGLPKIKFDLWTGLLVEKTKQIKSISSNFNSSNNIVSNSSNANGINFSIDNFKTSLSNIIISSKSVNELFLNTMNLIKEINFNSENDLFLVAKEILYFRQNFRHRLNINYDFKKDGMFLLQIMAEEILYIGYSEFSDTFNKELVLASSLGQVKNFNSAVDNKTKGNSNRVLKTRQSVLRGIQVQLGDILVSKSTGSGSSSFIAFSMSKPSIFSHSTPIWLEQDQGVLKSPEAFIEDGVKLRDLQKDYMQGSKTRMYIYRYNSKNVKNNIAVYNYVEAALDNLVTAMNLITNNQAQTVASYAYDFSMSPVFYGPGGVSTTNQTPKKFICSAVGFNMYPSMYGIENPYSKKYWSKISSSNADLFQIIGVNAKSSPAPGDVESNPYFSMVGLRIDVTKLEQERIENAIIDNFLKYISKNNNIVKSLATSFKGIGNESLKKSDLKKMLASQLLSKEQFEKINSMVDQVPDGVNIKQLIFFYMMNEVVTPKLRSQVQESISTAKAKNQILGPLELRSKISSITDLEFEKYFNTLSGFLKNLK